MKRCLQYLTPDTAAVVIGIGGLGHLVLEFLRELSSARIIAVDREEAALKMAQKLGAHVCLPSDDTTVASIFDSTGGLGTMAVLDFVGIDQTLTVAQQVIRQQGQIVVVGLGGGSLPFQAGAVPYGCSVLSTLGGSTGELAEVVALAEAGRIRPKIERFALDDVAEVYEKLHKNEILGRAVLAP